MNDQKLPGNDVDDAIKVLDDLSAKMTPARLTDPRLASNDGYPDYVTQLEAELAAPIHEEQMDIKMGLIALKNYMNRGVNND